MILQSPPVSEFDPNPAINRWLVGFKSGLKEIDYILLSLFKPLFQISPEQFQRFDYERAKTRSTCTTSNVNDVDRTVPIQVTMSVQTKVTLRKRVREWFWEIRIETVMKRVMKSMSRSCMKMKG